MKPISSTEKIGIFLGEVYLGFIIKSGWGCVYAYGPDDSPVGCFQDADAAIEYLRDPDL